MRKLAKECREQHLKDLHAEHPLFQFIEAILSNASLAQPNMPRLKDTICTTVASSVCLILYTDTQNQMEVEALGFLLQKVCELSPLTAKDVVMWLSQGQDDEVCAYCYIYICLILIYAADVQCPSHSYASKDSTFRAHPS